MLFHGLSSSAYGVPRFGGVRQVGNTDSHALACFLELGIHTPTLWRGRLIWDMDSHALACYLGDMDSHSLARPLELGIRTPLLFHGPSSWGYGLPHFGMLP